MKSEEQARRDIDAALAAAGWARQRRDTANLQAARGVAIREFPLSAGHGFADDRLYADGRSLVAATLRAHLALFGNYSAPSGRGP